MKGTAKRISLATIFGVLTFCSKSFLPSPLDKLLIVFQATLLALGSLLLRRMGATYVGSIGGVLTALWRTTWAPFTLIFAFLYGLLVDVFFFLLNVNADESKVGTWRIIIAMTLSTTVLGFLSYYVTVFIFDLIQRNLIMEFSLLFAGSLNGAIAGYLTSLIRVKYLRNATL